MPTGVEDPDEYPWVFPTRGAIVGSPAAIPPANPPDACTIVAASMDGNLYALDGGSGRPAVVSRRRSGNLGVTRRRRQPRHIIGNPNIVVGDVAGRLHTFDTNGNRVWTTQLDGPITAGAAHLTAAPAADLPGGLHGDPGDRLYVGTQRGTLYTLNPRDGSVAAITTLDGPIVSTPAVIGGFDPQPDPPKVYVGTTNGTLYALYADDLSERWSLPLGGPITGTPAIGNPHIVGDPHLAIFAPSGDGTLHALEEINGRPETLWTTPVARRDRHLAHTRQRRHLPRSRRLQAPRPRRSNRTTTVHQRRDHRHHDLANRRRRNRTRRNHPRRATRLRPPGPCLTRASKTSSLTERLDDLNEQTVTEPESVICRRQRVAQPTLDDQDATCERQCANVAR